MEILSQAEIEALLATLTGDGEMISPDPADGASSASNASSASDGRSSLPAAFPEFRSTGMSASRLGDERRTIAYEPYDFRRPDKFSKDQLRTLRMLHETFARLFASSLSA